MDEALIQASELYREHILDHYKHPRNFGALKDAEIRQRELNPLCGDELEFFLKLGVNGHKSMIQDVKFRGHGCAISQASASIFSEMIKGKSLEDVERMKTDDIIQELAIPIGPVRHKCAVLSVMTVKAGIENYKNTTRGKNE